MRKDFHFRKHQRHIPFIAKKKCPVFQYESTWVTFRNGNRLFFWKEIKLPNWKFSQRFLKGEYLDGFIEWIIEQLTHESIHQAVHETENFEASEALD